MRKLTLVFDGGSRGNPGQGYGSFVYRFASKAPLGDGTPAPQRLSPTRLLLDAHMTNNEAEYDTLIRGLQALLTFLGMKKEDPKTVTLEVRGDSQLVICQVSGEWKTREARLATRRDEARDLLSRFGHYHLLHQPRARSVELLGH